MSFADLTPEQRVAMRKKAAETRAANKAERSTLAAKIIAPGPQAIEPEEEAQEPKTLADIGFLANPVDPYAGVLSAGEKAEIDRAAKAKVQADQRAAIKKAYEAEALEAARREAQAVPPDEERQKWLEERVRIRIILPSLRTMSGREIPPDPIILDQKFFVHGVLYTVPRHQALYLESVMNGARVHMAQVDGRSRTYYNTQLGTMIYQGGVAQGGSGQ